MCFAATGRLQGRAAKLLLVRWQSPGILQVLCKFALQLTARQYGEVVLPDASTGQVIVTVDRKTVTVQGGYGAVFAVRAQI